MANILASPGGGSTDLCSRTAAGYAVSLFQLCHPPGGSRSRLSAHPKPRRVAQVAASICPLKGRRPAICLEIVSVDAGSALRQSAFYCVSGGMFILCLETFRLLAFPVQSCRRNRASVYAGLAVVSLMCAIVMKDVSIGEVNEVNTGQWRC